MLHICDIPYGALRCQVPSSNAVLSRRPSRDMKMAKSGEEAERALANMARAARKVGPNDRVVELRKVCRLSCVLNLRERFCLKLFVFLEMYICAKIGFRCTRQYLQNNQRAAPLTLLMCRMETNSRRSTTYGIACWSCLTRIDLPALHSRTSLITRHRARSTITLSRLCSQWDWSSRRTKGETSTSLTSSRTQTLQGKKSSM